MKYCFLFIGLTAFMLAVGQDSTFVDPRDGEVYELVHIGSTTWFASNLKFKTETSWCEATDLQEGCEKGNFYFNTDLKNLCPIGWHVSTWTDWENAIPFFEEHFRADTFGIQIDTLDSSYDAIMVSGIKLMEDGTWLKLTPSGWIQGKKRRKRRFVDLWILDPKDDRRHLHLGKDRYIVHSHDSHIHDKPKRVRRFPVRCVKD